MKAAETLFKELVDSTKQYIVPLYQRPYSWGRKEWDVLWEDLMYLCENAEPKLHFMGSIVTAPAENNPAGVSRYILIDGQQRMTTLSVLLCVLRDAALEMGMEKLCAQVHEKFIVNKFEEAADFFKLIPTQGDREAYYKIVKVIEEGGRIEKMPDTQIDDCYLYFQRMLRRDKPDLEQVLDVIIGRLSIVSIALDNDDNPHLVFESLNGKGRPLTQADLIRNYFFMRIPIEDQDRSYQRYWRPMQEMFGDALTEFIRHYLIFATGNWVKTSDVYFMLKQRVDSGEVDARNALSDLSASAQRYSRFIDPDSESDSKLAEAFRWFKRAQVTTIYPFFLGVYQEYERKEISRDELIEVLALLQNYIIRRIIGGYPTNQLNKNFSQLYKNVAGEEGPIPERVKKALQGRGYPSDSHFRKQLVESKLYGKNDREKITRLVLESIEESYGHKEGVDLKNLTIEHVMPQTLTEAWVKMLGDDALVVHELYLHTLGNLTLTGYNAEMSNAPFEMKRGRLASSHVELNRYFSKVDVWNRDHLIERGEMLAEQALKIWPYFGDVQAPAVADQENVTGSTPVQLSIYNELLPVHSWREVLTGSMEWLIKNDYDSALMLLEEYPALITLDESNLKRPYRLSNGWYCETYLTSKSVFMFCSRALQQAGVASGEWGVGVVGNGSQEVVEN